MDTSFADDARRRIAAAGIKIIAASKIPYGIKFELDKNGRRAIANVFFGKNGPKVTAQGKSEEIKKIIEDLFRARMLLPRAPYIGTDESGKGDYFGPLVVAAFFSDEKTDDELSAAGVRDSKTLSDAAVLRLARRISEKYPDRVSLRGLMPGDYNRAYETERLAGGNLNTLLARLHRDSAAELARARRPEKIIVDAFSRRHSVRESIAAACGVGPSDVFLVEKGEKYPAVAAASVLARAKYLDKMSELGRMLKISLPKGAGAAAKDLRRTLIERYGESALGSAAKISFKMA